MEINEISQILKDYGLKVTPQRLAVYEALYELGHPYADDIVTHVRQKNPSISVATIYNTLEHFEKKNLLFKLETCHDKMRYDCGMHKHYHICNPEEDKMEDYHDPELQALIEEYLKTKHRAQIKVRDIRLLIIGSIEK
jgi:Fur family transcriptional regulator, peroxide stress response regulator